MMLSRKTTLVVGGILSAVVLTGCGVTNTDAVAAPEGAAFYEGQTINLMVPFDAGGGSDIMSRSVADHLAGLIEGKPSIVVENIPGGGQKTGLNGYERSAHNGFNLAQTAGGIIMDHNFDPTGIQFDITKYEPVVAFGGDLIVFTGADSGITSIEDLAESTEKVFYGGLALNAGEVARVFALEQIVGEDRLETLFGYDGSGPVLSAVMRNELTIGATTSAHYLQNIKPLEEDGSIVPLMVLGYVEGGEIVRDPAFPDLPTMAEAFEKTSGKKAKGIGWDAYTALNSAASNLARVYWIHGDAPEAARTALHAAVGDLVKDKKFVDAATKMLGDYKPVTGKNLAESWEEVNNIDPATVTWIKDYLNKLAR